MVEPKDNFPKKEKKSFQKLHGNSTKIKCKKVHLRCTLRHFNFFDIVPERFN